MNDIVKNTELFVNILSMSRTSAVQKWDDEAFQRAFRWAHYFEQVHKKTKGKAAIAERISKQLSIACSEVDAKLGLSPLQYDDLPRASLILRKNLLENVYLNNDFYLQLAGQLNESAEQVESFKKQLQAFSKLKATLQILQIIQKRLEAKMQKPGVDESDRSDREVTIECDGRCNNRRCKSSGKAQIKANAILLRKCLMNVVGSDDNSSYERKKQQLHTKLSGMIKHDSGLDVLLVTLISNDGCENVSRYILDFIEEILAPKWKEDWKKFLLFPLVDLFGQCGDVYPRFTDLYLDVVRHCADCLQKTAETCDYELLVEKKVTEATEHMYNYYYCLLQNNMHMFAQASPGNELKVESLIKKQCQSINDLSDSVWTNLSRDFLASSEI